MSSDLWANLALVAAPAALVLGLFRPPGAARRGLAVASGLFAAQFLLLAAILLPEAPISGGLFGASPRLALALAGLGLVAWQLLLPERSTWVATALVLGIALALVPYSAVAFGAGEIIDAGLPLSDEAGVLAGDAADAVRGRTGLLARLACALAVVGGAACGRAQLPPARLLLALVGALAGILPSGSTAHVAFAGGLGVASYALALPGWSFEVRLDGALRGLRLRLLGAALLLGCVGFGAFTSFIAYSGFGDLDFIRFTTTGWTKLMDGKATLAGLLPMTGAYLLVPVAGALFFWDTRRRFAVLGAGVLALLVMLLVAQRETGLVFLLAVAVPAMLAVAWNESRVARYVAIAMVLSVPAFLVLAEHVPFFWGIASEFQDRLSFVRGSAGDHVLAQPYEVSDTSDTGLLGLGLREPGHWFELQHWGTDLVAAVHLRLFGVAGLGLIVAALMPGIAALQVAWGQRYAGRGANVLAVFATGWGVLTAAGVLLVGAGALRVIPFSGVTMGWVVPGLNHFLFAVPAFWVIGRAAAGARNLAPSGSVVSALVFPQRALALTTTALLAVIVVRKVDAVEPVIPPAEDVDRVRVRLADGGLEVREGLLFFEAFDHPVQTGPLVLEASGSEVFVSGLAWSEAALRDGVSLGAAGRFAPFTLTERLPWSNDVWLERYASTRWREAEIFWDGGPWVRSARAGGSIAAEGCTSTSTADACALAAGDTLTITVDEGEGRGERRYAFVVSSASNGLELEWTEGAPEPWRVPESGLLFGGASLGARQAPEQIDHDAGGAVASLLGQEGALVVQADRLAVGVRPDPASAPEAERALVELAALVFDETLTKDSNCAGGWAFLADPRSGGRPCVEAGALSDWGVRGDALVSVRWTHSQILSSLRHPEARRRRGVFYDHTGRALHDGSSRSVLDPSLEPLLGRYEGGGDYSGLERALHRVVGGLHDEALADELLRRWRGERRAPGTDVVLTIDAEQQAAVSEAAGGVALAVAAASGKEALVDAVLLTRHGEIRAVVTVSAEPDGTLSYPGWNSAGRDPSSFTPYQPMGRIRALGDVRLTGSAGKPFLYARYLESYGDLVQDDEGLWFVDDTGAPIVDEGVLSRFEGRNVTPCRGGRAGHPIELVDAISESRNYPACYVAAAMGPEGLREGYDLLGYGRRIDLFAGIDPVVAARIQRRSSGMDAVSAQLGVWYGAPLAPHNAPKMGQGLWLRRSAVGLAVETVSLIDGLAWEPTLLQALVDDGVHVEPERAGVRVFGDKGRLPVLQGMQETDVTGTAAGHVTASTRLWMKTGTGNQSGRPSNKAAVAITTVTGEALVLAVVVPDAGDAYPYAAVEVVEGVVQALAPYPNSTGGPHATR